MEYQGQELEAFDKAKFFRNIFFQIKKYFKNGIFEVGILGSFSKEYINDYQIFI